MSEATAFAIFAAKVAIAYAAIAAFQKHVMVLPVVGQYLPLGKS